MAGLQLPFFDVPSSLPTPISPQLVKPSPLPWVLPTIFDANASDPQDCPGYKAWSFQPNHQGFTADLRLAGEPCNVFGRDVVDLVLQVSHQTKERLSVRIFPKYLSPSNSSWFVLDDQFVQIPQHDGATTTHDSDLQFDWTNEPTFQFSVSRRSTNEEIFSTLGHVIVYEDQYLELITNMIDDYSIYGLAETVRNFRFGANFTATLFNVDSADQLDRNSYGSHPFYQETRYHRHGSSTAHGVYARNAHAQEWLMRDKTLTYRTIGGSFDLHFLSGESHGNDESSTMAQSESSALEVIRQYQQCVGFPAMQQYWAFGFHQCHWGWGKVQDLRDVVDNYRNASVPLEAIWTDIDVYYKYRPLTNDPQRFSSEDMQSFVAGLRANGQHYVPLVDSNVYRPNPDDSNDVYPPYQRGNDLGIFISDPSSGKPYVGSAWPGDSVWADWSHPASQQWFTNELSIMNHNTPFDGIWIDINEASNFCNVLCGSVEPASANTAGSREQDARNLNFPPYRINNVRLTHQIIDGAIPFTASHWDGSREYDAHNLFALGISRAAYNALASESIHQGKRPFIIARSTFIGNGRYAGHWGGDNESKWGALALSISQALIFQMAGIPMFGTDTCGFGGPSGPTEELCARWMALNAFMPFYRNHYGVLRPPQEAYVWEKVAEASRRAIGIRYSLLTYIYTLFHFAHVRGDTVVRALAWEFPDDESLKEADLQFLVGPSLLVTPVVTEGATTVNGVFPGIGKGTRWYDWYTLGEVTGVGTNENVTMAAPLEHINLHIRGGCILPLQAPGYTTRDTRNGLYALVIALDNRSEAKGSLYLDDGESIEQDATKMINFHFANSRFTLSIDGQYHATASLENVTIAGLHNRPQRAMLTLGDGQQTRDLETRFGNHTLYVTGLSNYFTAGAWESEWTIRLL